MHSKYSRACSRDCDLEHLAWWARRKGIGVVGTGDFTHPAWHAALTEQLVEAEPGLYRLRPELERAVDQKLAPSCRGTTRFMLSVEISTIYKRDGATRKVHHLVYLPDLAAVGRFNAALGRIGNLGSDGRPILGLDSRDLLEITLDASPDGYLVPAHVWTPWFAALGSKSGFDAIADCYADLADHVFAIETGLSSDPPMNWRVSALDRYALVSNSDAHSPPALGREATRFTTPYDFFAMRDALRTRDGLDGTIEFFPEEGKYHLDGHRKCAVRLEPEQTRKLDGRCPTCDKPLTVGVLHRVEALADRPEGHRPPRAASFRNLVPLPEILGEIHGVGPKSKTVDGKVVSLVAELGSELSILTEVPIDEVTRAGGTELGEAVARLRRGEVRREGGYDGEYGRVRLFEPGELSDPSAGALFDLGPDPNAMPRKRSAGGTRARSVPRQRAVPAQDELLTADGTAPPEALAGLDHVEPVITGMERLGTGLLDLLDPDQKAAAQVTDGPVLIIAGPGTGKTRTLIQRLGHLIAECGVPAERCLAITFTRRAADEMRERLRFLLAAAQPEQRDAATGAGATVSTFHALGLSILREHPDRFGLTAGFRIADADEQLDAVGEAAGLPDDETAQARRLLRQLQEFRRNAGRLRADARGAAPTDGRPGSATAGAGDRPEPADDLTDLVKDYTAALRARDLVDLDELVRLPVQLLSKDEALVAAYRRRFTHVFVDEYQDVDDTQYALLRLLCPADGNLCAIGDPDQSIYSFRGAEVGYFLRFAEDFPTATVVRLTRNYRSTAPILAAAVQAIAPDTLVAGRSLAPARRGAINGARITRYSASSPADEADFVARTVDALVGGSSFHALDSGRVDSREHGPLGGVSFADIAVLYRTDAQAGPIIDALSRSGVPVQKRSHDRLLDRPGVAAIVDELRYATGIDGAIAARVRLTAQVLVGRGDRPDANLTDADIHTAVELLMPLAARCGADLETFLAELATGAEVDTWDPRADRVTLLTLHASKGLEFPVVFLVGCEDGLLPHRLPGRPPTDEQLAEERRLLFVGITRAKDRLYLSHAARRQRRGDGEPRPADASPFLAAIDHRLYDRIGDDPEPRRPQARQLRLI
ncbi:DNA helicase [Actinocatenispora thailandica]|uniref:DNA 3'-5' helicase n=1 Tax=Actinocatenispora thailandica TaxID=227318 RepID=A0A7R7DW64_9ACTN|nr:UvrD-helicase domain-containing protein [Actinocatenispora thailandica]BCJ38998.1 DNA helicase [Actinocatenispora thailandica]